ncbi:hypothetical protein [Azospirillum sp.]|uniref:hypothetical protein n=1 Tax=Azospirillum sp. TaxID=34012 RepID=UPI003D73E350
MDDEAALRSALRAVDYLLGHIGDDPAVLAAAVRRMAEVARLLPAGGPGGGDAAGAVSAAVTMALEAGGDRTLAAARLRLGWMAAVRSLARRTGLHAVPGLPADISLPRTTGDG